MFTTLHTTFHNSLVTRIFSEHFIADNKVLPLHTCFLQKSPLNSENNIPLPTCIVIPLRVANALCEQRSSAKS
jgi:hypothetical protein